MNELQRRQTGDIVTTEERGPVEYHVHYHAAHWLSAFSHLHPISQIALAVGAGLALPAVIFAAGSLLAGVATFALAMMGIISELLIVVGAGIGILAIVVIGVIAILKV